MKKVILVKELINYLNEEIIIVRRKPSKTMTEIKDESYMQGYKDGQIDALMRVLNHLWMNNL